MVTADRLPRGPMLATVFVTFGVLVVALSNSEVFWLSVAATAGIGASADATSVPAALTLSGALLVVFAFAALAASSTLRAR